MIGLGEIAETLMGLVVFVAIEAEAVFTKELGGDVFWF